MSKNPISAISDDLNLVYETESNFHTYIRYSQGLDIVPLREKSGAIANCPVLTTLAILAPEHLMQDSSQTLQLLETMTREYGTSDRIFKSAIIWVIADTDTQLREEARKLLAWEDIRDEERDRLDSQKRQLDENLKKAERACIEGNFKYPYTKKSPRKKSAICQDRCLNPTWEQS